ncbi:dTDP-4-dehydrorhamnose reductase [Sandaracinus amylolyticus]|uniref:dTDP-4-dehydrorhamnose reductase n=1 Tax=Sandaracinus amylolyticus TaxID=927083 RepID=A0A0F6YJC2_9BACT|nr:dTDP-4-dehydrorhamnose reductase [Sandaracinus amylolyticus]AKF07170.1 dTDP-4-dehydrorhamnose reductase [Sandaracinus amylolyticus]
MTTLLISPDGMLGRAFVEALGEGITGVSYPQIDLTKPETITAHLTPGVTRVINCSAYTDVDGAETNEALANAINGHGVEALAKRCREIGATLIHFGTDYVFDGNATKPYPVSAPLAPQGAYGRSKALGETLLRESGAQHLYVRTSWLYAPWAKNFVRTIASLAKTKSELKVVDDQRGRPTSAEHLARTTLALSERGKRGTWHVTDGGECSWFDFAREIVRLGGSSCVVHPCTTAEFPRPAKRPAYSVLDLAETESVLGAMPDWRENLASVMARLE